MLWKCFDGSEHPVSSHFCEVVPEWLSGVPHQDVEAMRQSLLVHGTGWENGRKKFFISELDASQRSLLRGLDHVLNMNRALEFLDGRDYRSHNEMFGPKGTLCQVHGNSWSPDTCGCRLIFIFDHWLRGKPKEITIYPHHFGVQRCARHVHIGDFRDHFYTVMRENEIKNLAQSDKGRFAAPL